MPTQNTYLMFCLCILLPWIHSFIWPLTPAGILMLIGWMMCASTALIMAKYYKPMWPNSSLCNEKVWFAVSQSFSLFLCRHFNHEIINVYLFHQNQGNDVLLCWVVFKKQVFLWHPSNPRWHPFAEHLIGQCEILKIFLNQNTPFYVSMPFNISNTVVLIFCLNVGRQELSMCVTACCPSTSRCTEAVCLSPSSVPSLGSSSSSFTSADTVRYGSFYSSTIT